MLLDIYNTVYVWIGNCSNKFEKKGALKSAAKYIQSVNDQRDKDEVGIVEVEPGKEPTSFTVNFLEWHEEYCKLWLEQDPAFKQAVA